MMSRHHKPPSKSNRSSSTNHHRLHKMSTGGTAPHEEPMMIHSHRHDDEDSMRPVVHLQPNLIARLMGIDDAAAVVRTPTPPPAPRKPVAAGIVQFQAQRRQTNKGSLQLPYYYSYRGGNDDDDAEYSGPRSSRLCLHRMTMRVPASGWRPRPRRRRRHPQEEELLQKMRQDLQAWQASRAPPLLQTSSRPSDSDGGGRSSSLVLQAIAQEDLRKQKMARYGLAFGLGGRHNKVPPPDELSLTKNKKKNAVAQGQGGPTELVEHAAAEPAATPQDTVSVAAPAAAAAEEESGDSEPRKDAGHGHGASSAHQELPSHTPIVLLKPTTTSSESDTAGVVSQKTVLFGLPKHYRDTGMNMLLEEVKDRVQRELTVLTAATSDDLIKTTPASSAWAIPPLLQQQVTKEDGRGNKRQLFRSESFRAFRRDRKRNASPEAYTIIPKSEAAVSLSLEDKADDEESVTDASLSVLRPGVGGGGVTDGQSFRSECLTLTKHRDDGSPSPPRLLFRSFSAPESLGRLFSFKQHEASSEPAAAVRMTGKSIVSAGFSSFIRGTVSSLRRHGFRSRRNLMMFRRKTHWSSSNSNNKTALGVGEIHPSKIEMEMPICTTPPSQETFNLFKVAQANLSELPPSPVSPLEVAAGHSSRHFFSDLHFTLPPELSPRCVSDFEPPATASEPTTSYRTDITAVEAAWSRDRAYITEVLIAAGLYDDDGGDGPSSAINSRVDSMARPMPICDDVFEDVEDMYYYRGDYIGGGGMCDDETDGGATAATDHRMLFDLANEALQSLVVESSRGGSSSLRQWVVDSTGVARGKKLVDDVWQQVQALRNHPEAQEMRTIDGMVAYEVRRSVWAEVLSEDVYVVGRKIERAIFDELIEELVACAGDLTDIFVYF